MSGRARQGACCRAGHPWVTGSYTWQYGGNPRSPNPYRVCIACHALHAQKRRALLRREAAAARAAALLRATMTRLRGVGL